MIRQSSPVSGELVRRDHNDNAMYTYSLREVSYCSNYYGYLSCVEPVTVEYFVGKPARSVDQGT